MRNREIEMLFRAEEEFHLTRFFEDVLQE